MQFTHSSQRTILPAAMVATVLLATPGLLLAQGKGNGGDEPTSPPPVTYQITWIDNLYTLSGQWDAVNQNGDLLGKNDNTDPYAFSVVYSGEVYPLDVFFLDLDEAARYTFSVSDRSVDGSIYLCGTCATSNGIRGYVMRLTPNFDGTLERTDFSLATPVEGDDITALKRVNSSGIAVGYSRLSSAGNEQVSAMYHTPVNGTIPLAFPAMTSGHFITNSGTWVGPVNNPDGSFSIYSGIPGDLLLCADNVFPEDVNNLGHFLGQETIYTTTKKGTTYTTWNFLFDGTLHVLNEGAPTVRSLNDIGDRLSEDRVEGRRNEPSYNIGFLYFGNIDRELSIDDMIDSNNANEDLMRWYGANRKSFDAVTNNGTIVGSTPVGDSYATFILTPIER